MFCLTVVLTGVSCISEKRLYSWIKVISTSLLRKYLLPVSLSVRVLEVILRRPCVCVCYLRCSSAVSSDYLCPPAAEEEAHRQRHCSHRVPGGEHTLCARHDPVQLPACICGGAGGERMYGQCHLQGWF